MFMRVDYAKEAVKNPNVTIVQVWEEDAERGEAGANELGVPFERDLMDVLQNDTIDGVVVTSSTDQHKKIMLEAARCKKHIFTEKMLAFTSEDTDEILANIAEAKINFMISLPRLTKDYYLYVQQLMDQGKLGKGNMIRCRVAHNGAVPTGAHPNG